MGTIINAGFELRPRLAAVANLVLPGQIVADIGANHGYLPLYLVERGICPQAIAADSSENALVGLREYLANSGIKEKIALRLGNGLQVLAPGEAATICLAGMGGQTIQEILSASPKVARSARRLLLQPQKGIPALRRYLQANGWRLVAEDIAYDSGFYYEILALEPGQMVLSENELRFGPLLMSQKHPLFRPYWRRKLKGVREIVTILENMTSIQAQERYNYWQEEVGRIERILRIMR
ncbi:MAG: class I SAM-dependent methyltransferase [Clostridiales bacterium]|jgi:tRNA (adenine22-N1)-methyltransferase|nr:class I SAM-dependent methyltransferase [Clostridiales bacterium]MDR2713836.1 class I SAM-dependent methyltransferase [Clostridiales bacterium]